MLRGCEAMISTPNGIGQAMVAKLLLDWKYDGYVRWLRGIKATYAMRRDWMVSLITGFSLQPMSSRVPFSSDRRNCH